jgi:hypothetical protein
MIVIYDHKTFIVQANGLKPLILGSRGEKMATVAAYSFSKNFSLLVQEVGL